MAGHSAGSSENMQACTLRAGPYLGALSRDSGESCAPEDEAQSSPLCQYVGALQGTPLLNGAMRALVYDMLCCTYEASWRCKAAERAAQFHARCGLGD